MAATAGMADWWKLEHTARRLAVRLVENAWQHGIGPRTLGKAAQIAKVAVWLCGGAEAALNAIGADGTIRYEWA